MLLFLKYIDDKEQLELKKPDILKNNTFYAKEESNEKGHIFIFFEDAEDAIEKFKEIIKPHSSSDVFFNLTSEQISSWISQYKSEIECLCILGCKIQLSKGVNMYRIDISLKGSFTWAQINSVNANKRVADRFYFLYLVLVRQTVDSFVHVIDDFDHLYDRRKRLEQFVDTKYFGKDNRHTVEFVSYGVVGRQKLHAWYHCHREHTLQQRRGLFDTLGQHFLLFLELERQAIVFQLQLLWKEGKIVLKHPPRKIWKKTLVAFRARIQRKIDDMADHVYDRPDGNCYKRSTDAEFGRCVVCYSDKQKHATVGKTRSLHRYFCDGLHEWHSQQQAQ